MHVSEQNVGDIFLLESGKRLQIDAVTPQYIHYTEETGDKYCTTERSIAAQKVTAPAAIADFRNHVMLGQLLRAAEAGALRRMLNGRYPEEERRDASGVLGMVKQQQKLIHSRLAAQRAIQPRKASSLTSRIQTAEQRHSTPSADADPRKPGHGR